jgi:serine/threonine protein kinase
MSPCSGLTRLWQTDLKSDKVKQTLLHNGETYNIRKLIRKGKFSEALLAEAPGGRLFILKKAKGAERHYIEKEFSVLQQVFPEIPISLMEREDELLLLKPWVEGNVLSGNFKSIKNDEQTFRKMLHSLLNQLENLHQNKLLHNDIKPENIIINPAQAKARLIDFGNVLEIGNIPRKFHYTFVYGPQEAILQYADLMRFSSDLFALGMTLIHWLTGAAPVVFQNPTFGLHQQINYRFPGSKLLTDEWNRLLQKATNQHSFDLPVHRYAKEEVREMVQRAQKKRFANIEEFRIAVEQTGPVFKKRKRFGLF